MKKALITIIVIAVIAIAAALAYQAIFLSPERVTKTALEKMFAVKSYHQSGILLLAGKVKGIDLNAKADIESDSDLTDKKSPKVSGAVNIALAAQGLQLMFSSEFKKVNENAYLRLVQIPELFKNTKIPFDISKYKELWIRIPLDKYKNTKNMDPQAMMAEVEKWAKEEKIFSKIEKLKTENINGNSCRHYMCVLNKEALLNLFKRLDKISGKNTDEKTFTEASQELNKIKDINIELWVAKKDMMLNKIKIAEVEIRPMNLDNSVKISFEGVYSKYDVPVSVQPPEISISIEEIIAEFLKGFKITGAAPTLSTPQTMPIMPPPMPVPTPVPTK